MTRVISPWGGRRVGVAPVARTGGTPVASQATSASGSSVVSTGALGSGENGQVIEVTLVPGTPLTVSPPQATGWRFYRATKNATPRTCTLALRQSSPSSPVTLSLGGSDCPASVKAQVLWVRQAPTTPPPSTDADEEQQQADTEWMTWLDKYQYATGALVGLANQLMSGAIDCATSLDPALSQYTLFPSSRVPADEREAFRKAWNDYATARDNVLIARTQCVQYKADLAAAGGSGGSTSGGTSGGTSTGSGQNVVYVYPGGETARVYGAYEEDGTLYIPTQGSGSSVVTNPYAYTDIVPNPYVRQPAGPAVVEDSGWWGNLSTTKRYGIGVGGAVLLGLGAWLLMRGKRTKRSRLRTRSRRSRRHR